jgi:P2-related tail formation protein
VEALAADTDTQVGWQPLLDVTTAPAKVLPYLAMFVGAVVTPNLSTDQARALIRSAGIMACNASVMFGLFSECKI